MLELLNALEWFEPWDHPLDEDRAQVLEGELRGEIGERHVLWGRSCTVVAARGDRDDVLFLVDGVRLAIVHLTWSQETDPAWPRTSFIGLEAFKEEMKQTYVDFV